MFMKRTLIAAAAALALTAAPVYAESEAEPADIQSVVDDFGMEDDGSFAETVYLPTSHDTRPAPDKAEFAPVDLSDYTLLSSLGLTAEDAEAFL